MKRIPFVLALTLLLGCSAARALADNASFVPATEASRNAHVVNKGVHWYTGMEEAQAAAKKEGKLIFWMHMLGTMEGAT